ncbi:MAG: hypothetical protein ACR2PA_18395 [Hyphomicrobiaceae bacterium]
MSNRQTPAAIKAGLMLGVIAGFTLPASAQQNVMKVCGAEWQKVKDKNDGEAPKGMTWKKFLGDCRKRVAVTKAKSPVKTSTSTPNSKVVKPRSQLAASQNAMKVCGAEWQKVKDKNNGKAPKGMTWKTFLGDCRNRQPRERLAAKTSRQKPNKSAARSKASGESMMSACGDEWRELKEKNKVPKGMTWTTYLGDCSKRYAGKFKPTPNQIAMYKRIRKCGTLWREAKDKGRLKTNLTWPQYWSDCNARLTRSKR